MNSLSSHITLTTLGPLVFEAYLQPPADARSYLVANTLDGVGIDKPSTLIQRTTVTFLGESSQKLFQVVDLLDRPAQDCNQYTRYVLAGAPGRSAISFVLNSGAALEPLGMVEYFRMA